MPKGPYLYRQALCVLWMEAPAALTPATSKIKGCALPWSTALCMLNGTFRFDAQTRIKLLWQIKDLPRVRYKWDESCMDDSASNGSCSAGSVDWRPQIIMEADLSSSIMCLLSLLSFFLAKKGE